MQSRMWDCPVLPLSKTAFNYRIGKLVLSSFRITKIGRTFIIIVEVVFLNTLYLWWAPMKYYLRTYDFNYRFSNFDFQTIMQHWCSIHQVVFPLQPLPDPLHPVIEHHLSLHHQPHHYSSDLHTMVCFSLVMKNFLQRHLDQQAIVLIDRVLYLKIHLLLLFKRILFHLQSMLNNGYYQILHHLRHYNNSHLLSHAPLHCIYLFIHQLHLYLSPKILIHRQSFQQVMMNPFLHVVLHHSSHHQYLERLNSRIIQLNIL